MSLLSLWSPFRDYVQGRSGTSGTTGTSLRLWEYPTTPQGAKSPHTGSGTLAQGVLAGVSRLLETLRTARR
jgi:hypothetical protein